MSNNNMTNFYELKDVRKMAVHYHNPCFDDHQFKLPFRCGIIGSSSSGKTSMLLNLLTRMKDTFFHIFVVYKASEVLYEFLANKIGNDNITFYDDISKLPQPNLLPHTNEGGTLIVFDDQVAESEQRQDIIKKYAIRCRKIGKGVSLVYISQSYFKIPKMVRQQFNYLVLLKLSSKRDLQLVLSEYSLGLDRKDIEMCYKDATKEQFNFLKVSIDEPDDNKKFSKNFNEFYKVSSDSDDENSDA